MKKEDAFSIAIEDEKRTNSSYNCFVIPWIRLFQKIYRLVFDIKLVRTARKDNASQFLQNGMFVLIITNTK